MKKIIITLLCLSIGTLAAQAQTEASKAAGKFSFKEETHDFGEVPEGPIAECDFVFKNTGKEPIVINEAHGSCGCTVPEYSKVPVAPGKKGTIHVKYNTTGRAGTISKEVYVSSNAEQQTMVLHIRGTVTKKADDKKTAALAPGK